MHEQQTERWKVCWSFTPEEAYICKNTGKLCANLEKKQKRKEEKAVAEGERKEEGEGEREGEKEVKEKEDPGKIYNIQQ